MQTDRNSEAYSYAHTKTRMMERHGLELSLPEYQALCVGAASARPTVIERTPTDTQKIVSLIFQGRHLSFVFSENRKRVTTVLKPET